MRDRLSPVLERCRVMIGDHATNPGDLHGCFILSPGLSVISSGPASHEHLPETLWEHVSVASRSGPCPSWELMASVKALFWRDDEAVIQFHPPRSEYVNAHPYCLHLWKPPYRVILPPSSTLA
jgi:hypothetical protein